jgi:rare lipoprotein A
MRSLFTNSVRNWPVQFNSAWFKLPATAILSLVLMSACASGDQPDGPGSRFGVYKKVETVRNLPKSRTGNMPQYTVFGKQYKVMDSAEGFAEEGIASWYGSKFHGRKTSSGEVYDMYAMTAAHKHLPLPTFVRVTDVDSGREIVVKVNDRGPFVGDRIIDLSFAAAKAMNMTERGTANVRIVALSSHLPGPAAEPQMAAALAPEIVQPTLAAVPKKLPVTPIRVKDLPAASIGEPTQALTEIKKPLAGPAPSLAAARQQNQTTIVVPASASAEPVQGLPETVPTQSLVIQLGAFKEVANAQQMVTNVSQQLGKPAYIEQDLDNALYRVKMGPFQQGEVLQRTLDELTNVGIEGYPVTTDIR